MTLTPEQAEALLSWGLANAPDATFWVLTYGFVLRPVGKASAAAIRPAVEHLCAVVSRVLDIADKAVERGWFELRLKVTTERHDLEP